MIQLLFLALIYSFAWSSGATPFPPPPPPAEHNDLSFNLPSTCPHDIDHIWQSTCDMQPYSFPYYIDAFQTSIMSMKVVRKKHCYENCDKPINTIYVQVKPRCYNTIGAFIIRVNGKLHFALKHNANIVKWTTNTTIHFVNNGYCGGIAGFCSNPTACPIALVNEAYNECPTKCINFLFLTL